MGISTSVKIADEIAVFVVEILPLQGYGRAVDLPDIDRRLADCAATLVVLILRHLAEPTGARLDRAAGEVSVGRLRGPIDARSTGVQQIVVLRLRQHAIEAVIGVVRVVPAAIRRIDQTSPNVEHLRQFHAHRVLNQRRIAVRVVGEVGGLITGGVSCADEIAGTIRPIVGLGLGIAEGRKRSQFVGLRFEVPGRAINDVGCYVTFGVGRGEHRVKYRVVSGRGGDVRSGIAAAIGHRREPTRKARDLGLDHVAERIVLVSRGTSQRVRLRDEHDVLALLASTDESFRMRALGCRPHHSGRLALRLLDLHGRAVLIQRIDGRSDVRPWIGHSPRLGAEVVGEFGDGFGRGAAGAARHVHGENAFAGNVETLEELVDLGIRRRRRQIAGLAGALIVFVGRRDAVRILAVGRDGMRHHVVTEPLVTRRVGILLGIGVAAVGQRAVANHLREIAEAVVIVIVDVEALQVMSRTDGVVALEFDDAVFPEDTLIAEDEGSVGAVLDNVDSHRVVVELGAKIRRQIIDARIECRVISVVEIYPIAVGILDITERKCLAVGCETGFELEMIAGVRRREEVIRRLVLVGLDQHGVIARLGIKEQRGRSKVGRYTIGRCQTKIDMPGSVECIARAFAADDREITLVVLDQLHVV